MNYTRLIITDGRRDMLDNMLVSWAMWCPDDVAHTVIVNDLGMQDEGGAAYHHHLVASYFPDAQVMTHDTRRGLAGAIRTGWSHLPNDTDYVVHLEDDTVFTAPIDLDAWSAPLRADPNVMQVVLQRGPNNESEHAHGGILKAWQAAGIPLEQHDGYVTHQHLFSLQPCIYRRALTEVGWPEHGGEREFTDQLLSMQPDAKFAYLGTPDAEPVYIHAGYGQRSAQWQL